MLKKQQKRYQRHKRIRKELSGTAEKPRLCVFRTPKHIYAQLIDDKKNHTIFSASDLEIKKTTKDKTSGKEKLNAKISKAKEVGRQIAKKAIEKKISKVVFDRGGYKYHGRIKSLAEGAREQGLKF